MPGQFPDKKIPGVPPEVARYRAETEQFYLRAANAKEGAEEAAGEAAASASLSGQHAAESQEYAQQARDWSELHAQGVHFGPDEPAYDKKYDGQLWLKTNEQAATITKIRRWDADAAGQGLFPSASLYPGSSLYPNDKGEWKDFALNLS